MESDLCVRPVCTKLPTSGVITHSTIVAGCDYSTPRAGSGDYVTLCLQLQRSVAAGGTNAQLAANNSAATMRTRPTRKLLWQHGRVLQQGIC